MKKIILIVLLATGFVQAQNVNFPDANFKNALVSYPGNDTNGDGEIQYSEAVNITGIYVSAQSITDLSGIEAFTNLTNLECNFNQLTSLNLNTLTNLKHLLCDDNPISTLILPTSLETLNCNTTNLSNLNVNGFANLSYISCHNNHITTLNLNAMSSLLELDCSNNGLTVFSVNAPQLEKLSISNNALTTLNLSQYPNLKELYCPSNHLSALSLSGVSQLTSLTVANNLITTLDVSGLLALDTLVVNQNPITNIDISGLNLLKTFQCSSTSITSLTISNLSSLEIVVADSNALLTNLTLNNLPSLAAISTASCQVLSSFLATNVNNVQSITCSNNNLSVLDLSSFPNLNSLVCNANKFAALNFSAVPKLKGLYCSNNLFTTIDISACPLQCQFNASENPNLVSVFMKNGSQFCGAIPILTGNPNLKYVCADDNEIILLGTQFANAGMTVNVNGYCSFDPGGSYNTISGTVTVDSNNDGCDALDLKFPFIKVAIDDGINVGSAFTDLTGKYRFYTQAGTFSLVPEIENPSFFIISPANATVTFANTMNNIAVQDFCVAANGIHPDLEIVVAPITPARPGFDAKYLITYKNKGNQVLSQPYGISLFTNQNLMAFVSANVTPETVGSGALTWSYSNLLPFESRSIVVTFHVNAPTDATNPVNIGDVLTLTANAMITGTDETPQDNISIFNQTVVGSYDPNDITCVEGDVVSPTEIGKYLHYIINFENTGTDYAQNIVVKDIIDETKFDVSSLQILSSSHAVDAKITGNIAELIFQNIHLETGGHGNILLKVKTKSSLVAGNTVTNKGDIFFDYNFPVATNTAETVFQSLSVGEVEDASVGVFPNPTLDFITVKANSTIKSIQLFDVQGRILQTKLGNETENKIDITKHANGIYFLKIKTEKGIKIEKIIKK